ncbi:MAG: hypothetical protein RI894_702 [Bacteroidota bacterium]|jgi:glutamate racemase
MQKKQNTIGVFDSGIGGLTVARTIASHLPNESLVYFGDTAHLPYGDKSADAIRFFSLKIAKFLLDKGCKCIVVACNSATSTSINVLQEFFGDKVPIIGTVEPLTEYISQQLSQQLSQQPSQSITERRFKKIGIIGTKATIGSGMYEKSLHAKQHTLEVVSLATPLLVPMIEEGFFQNNISKTIIHNYLENSYLQNIDTLLLACTHYPLIRKEIEAYYKGAVKVFDSNMPVALEVERVLRESDSLSDLKSAPHRFFVSDYTESFAETTRLFWGEETVHLEKCAIF